jgi:signal transduction histidine kinase
VCATEIGVDDTTAPRERLVFALFLYIALTITSVLAIVVDGFSRRTIIGLLLAAAIGALYFFLGRPAFATKNERHGALFLVLMVPLANGLFFERPFFLPALFGLYPLCFSLVSTWYGQTLAAGGLSVGIMLSTANDDNWSRSGWIGGALIGAVSFAFSVIMGGWISGIIDESRARKGLIDELHATRAQLAQAQHDAGVQAERERLSAEIHDTLAQGFSSLLMLVRSASASVGTDNERAQTLLRSAEQTAKENLDEARSLVQSLAPIALQHGDLVAALHRMASAENALSVTVTVTGIASEAALSPAEDVVLLRAVQESLTNTRRHANATEARITLAYDASPVRATVTDNGTGFDPSTSFGSGLSGMRSRLASVGGRLEVTSSPVHGTTIEVSLA